MDFFVSIGFIKNAEKRNKVIDFAKNLGFSSPNIISRDANVSKRAQLGEGNVVMPLAVVNAHARIGNFCIINTSSIIEHDAAIGDFVHISTNTVVNGESVVGARTFVGSSVVIGNNTEVGEGCIVSAGEVILEDVPDGTFLRIDRRGLVLPNKVIVIAEIGVNHNGSIDEAFALVNARAMLEQTT